MDPSAVWQGLISAGPLAAVLGLAVYTLWHKLESERAEIKRLNEETQKLLRKLLHIGNGKANDEQG